MGISNSCLPVSSSTFQTFRSRSSISKLRYATQDSLTDDNNTNLININQASEDELLLLPGITRQLAVNIVQYRHNSNGFKQIDELLKVNGITSDLFKHFYMDITVEIPSSLDNKTELINLNLASYNQLCSIPGLTSNLAERIIERRERKGLFRFIEDLLKIKGIDYIVLATVRPYVTVNQQRLPTNDYTSSNILSPLLNRTNAADTLSMAALFLERLPPELQTIFVSTSSPPSSPITKNNNNKQNTFRFASWNLQQLTNEKVQNSAVREVICRTIVENNFSLIGIQEIGDKESLDLIIQELNTPTIPSVKDWSSLHQGKWKYTISDIAGPMFPSKGSEYLGFLYDESIGIELKQASLFPFPMYFTRLPYITKFRIYNKFEFVFVNIHLKTKELNEDKDNRTKDETKALSVLAQAMKNTMEQKPVIIFGDFNIIPTASEFEELIKCNYSYVIEQNTDIGLKTLQGTTCVDNIWLSAEAKAFSSGNSGVIRDNLNSMWIPAGWTWGGFVSDHCPIWMEFDLS